MQEFQLFLKQFCPGILATSYFLRADHKQCNIITQLKFTRLRTALNQPDENRKDFLSPLWWIMFPKPAFLYWPETERCFSFPPACSDRNTQTTTVWLLMQQIAGGILKLVDTSFSCPSWGCILLHTHSNFSFFLYRLLESCMFKRNSSLILNTAFIFGWYFWFNITVTKFFMLNSRNKYFFFTSACLCTHRSLQHTYCSENLYSSNDKIHA